MERAKLKVGRARTSVVKVSEKDLREEVMGKVGGTSSCFNCGKVGHKAAECVSTWAPQVSEVGEEVIGSVEVGGVWVVACVKGHVTT